MRELGNDVTWGKHPSISYDIKKEGKGIFSLEKAEMLMKK